MYSFNEALEPTVLSAIAAAAELCRYVSRKGDSQGATEKVAKILRAKSEFSEEPIKFY